MRRCRWCWRLGANLRGKLANELHWFHVDCSRAVELFHGWELEVSRVLER